MVRLGRDPHEDFDEVPKLSPQVVIRGPDGILVVRSESSFTTPQVLGTMRVDEEDPGAFLQVLDSGVDGMSESLGK